jgi:hypothetical protein
MVRDVVHRVVEKRDGVWRYLLEEERSAQIADMSRKFTDHTILVSKLEIK